MTEFPHSIDGRYVNDAEWFALLDLISLENTVRIEKHNIRDLPREWAAEAADQIVCDCPKYRYFLDNNGPYALLEEIWPANREEIEDMLASLNEMTDQGETRV